MAYSQGNSFVVVNTLDSDNEWFNQHLRTTKPTNSKSAQVKKDMNNNNTIGSGTGNGTGAGKGKGTAISTKPISTSPGRTRQTPIVVAGEDTIAPLIIVESRDISPDPRLRESHYTTQSNDHPTTEEEEKEDEEVDKSNHRRHRPSRTLSPPSRTTTTRITPSSSNTTQEQLDTIMESIKSENNSNRDTPNITKTATKESSITNSDAITTPHTNRTSSSRTQRQYNPQNRINPSATDISKNSINKTNRRSASVGRNANRSSPSRNNVLQRDIRTKDSSTSMSESPNDDDDNDDDDINRDEGLHNLVSMTSSITSAASNTNNDYYVKHLTNQQKQHLFQQMHEQQQQQQQQPIANSAPLSRQQMKTKNLVPQPGTNKILSKNGNPHINSSTKVDRSRSTKQHSQERMISKRDVSIVGDYPSTPQRPTSTKTTSDRTTPNSLYEAFDLNNDRIDASHSPFNNIVSPLSMNLSGVLRDSSSETASFFHDFHNPNIAVTDPPESKKSYQQTTTKVVARNASDTSNFHKHQNQNKSQQKERNVSSQNRYPAAGHSLIDCDQYETMSSSSISSNKHDVINHSILQLCTEDLMSDDTYLVQAAVCRLYDVCCIVTDSKRRNHVSEKETSSIISTSSTSSTILNRIRFLKAGGHALIVGVMKKYPTNAPIQAASCRLIHQLILMDEYNLQANNSNIESSPISGNSNQNTSNRNGGTGAFNELFSAVYGMDCVIAALQRFGPSNSERQNSSNNNTSDDDDVYNLACGALVAIVCSTSKMIDRLLQHDTRYISIFIKAIHAPINQRTSGVCRFIYYILKQYPQYVNEVVMAGGIEEVLDEMNQFPNSVNVQYCGCSAIGTLLQTNNRMILSSLSSSNNDVLLQQKYGNRSLVEYVVHGLDGAHVIVKAMKTFASIEDVQAKGVVALCNITTSSTTITSSASSKSKSKENESISTWIKQAGGLSAIGIALENFPKNTTIQNKGCLAIKTLLLDRASSFMVTSE